MTPFDEQEEGREPLIAAPGEDPRLDDAHLRRVLDAVPAPVSYVDTGLRFRYNNRAYDAWVGRPHEELYGTHVRDALGEKAYAEVLPYMREALSGRDASFEKELEYPDGSRRYVSVSYVPDFDAAGSVRGFVATDLEGRITYWNHFAERLYGWPAAEALGRDILEVTPAETSAEQAVEI